MLIMVPGESGAGFCANTANIWQLVGIGFLIFRIVIPIILIILGAKDLGQAVISNDEKEVSKSAKKFGMRVVAAVAVFFIPTLVGYVFTLIGEFSDAKDDYKICSTCITKPTSKKSVGSCNYYIDLQGLKGIPEKNEKYSVTTSVEGGNGTISNGNDNVNRGENFTVKFTPNANYEIASVTINSKKVNVEKNKYTIKNITEDKDVVVTYKQK